jgi:hypothetical protein
VRPESGRIKKLIVAFHFQFTNQAAWKCDACRKSGLERRRNCAWVGEAESSNGRIVWGRRQVGVTRCPKSIITAESKYLLDEFNVWKRCPGGSLHDLPARVVDAIILLESESQAEMKSASQEAHAQSIRR